MEKKFSDRPIKLEVTCDCGKVHTRHIETPDLVKELTNSHMSSMLDYINEIDWLKQRVEELEDELFVLIEFKPQVQGGIKF